MRVLRCCWLLLAALLLWAGVATAVDVSSRSHSSVAIRDRLSRHSRLSDVLLQLSQQDEDQKAKEAEKAEKQAEKAAEAAALNAAEGTVAQDDAEEAEEKAEEKAEELNAEQADDLPAPTDETVKAEEAKLGAESEAAVEEEEESQSGDGDAPAGSSGSGLTGETEDPNDPDTTLGAGGPEGGETEKYVQFFSALRGMHGKTSLKKEFEAKLKKLKIENKRLQGRVNYLTPFEAEAEMLRKDVEEAREEKAKIAAELEECEKTVEALKKAAAAALREAADSKAQAAHYKKTQVVNIPPFEDTPAAALNNGVTTVSTDHRPEYHVYVVKRPTSLHFGQSPPPDPRVSDVDMQVEAWKKTKIPGTDLELLLSGEEAPVEAAPEKEAAKEE